MNQLYWVLKQWIWGILVFPICILAQEKPNTSDQFHDYFFESLKYKGVENYDKALESLEKCLVISPNDATVHYEIARNHYFQKHYRNAQLAYEKSLQLDDTNTWALKGLYDVFYDSRDFNQAITVVNQ